MQRCGCVYVCVREYRFESCQNLNSALDGYVGYQGMGIRAFEVRFEDRSDVRLGPRPREINKLHSFDPLSKSKSNMLIKGEDEND